MSIKIYQKYRDYLDYVSHQKSKCAIGSLMHVKILTEIWERDVKFFYEDFLLYKDIILSCKDGICLGARCGNEVEALMRIGCQYGKFFGMDLNAHPPFVVKGDFHDLDYDDNSFDFIYSNSFDHSLHPEKFVSECERVLRPGGYCLLYLCVGESDEWGVNAFDEYQEIIDLFKNSTVYNQELKMDARTPAEAFQYCMLMTRINQ